MSICQPLAYVKSSPVCDKSSKGAYVDTSPIGSVFSNPSLKVCWEKTHSLISRPYGSVICYSLCVLSNPLRVLGHPLYVISFQKERKLVRHL